MGTDRTGELGMVGDVPTSLPTSRPPRRGAYFVQIEAIAVGTNAVLFSMPMAMCGGRSWAASCRPWRAVRRPRAGHERYRDQAVQAVAMAPVEALVLSQAARAVPAVL
jgi:hypothetical protein